MTAPPAPAGRVAITGIGLVTSLGLDVPGSLAAIRSGIANFTEHETVLIECNEYGTELCGVTVARLPESALSRDIHGADRTVALFSRAVRECAAAVPKQLQKNAVWRLSAGPRSGADLFALIQAALPDIPIHPVRENKDSESSRPLFFENIIQSTEQLKNRTIDICFVGCVDSLCDTPVLEELLEADRLKDRMANPEGIVAGEAAGVFALELESAAVRRGARILGYIDAWGRGVEPSPWKSGKTDFSGIGLHDCLKAALSSVPEEEELLHVIADLNGESFRAREWAFAASKAFAGKKKPDLGHPADCTGDCGAAMGVVLLSTALDVLSEAEPSTPVLVYTSDDGPERRALCLRTPKQRAASIVAPGKRESTGPAVPAVIAQHWEEASFLWSNRPRIAKSSTHVLKDLRQHDRRLLANLEGLSHAAAAGWNVWEHWPAFPESSDFFTAAFLAFTSSNEDAIQSLLLKADADTGLLKGIGSALGWLTWAAAKQHIDALFENESPYHRFVAVTASALHRHDPDHLLNRAVYDPCPPLKARALKAMGELGRTGTVNLVRLSHSYQAEDDAVRFWASWSGVLTQDPDAMPALVKFITPDSTFRHRAVDVAFRRFDRESALTSFENLARHSSTSRLAITAAGIIGDPTLVPWLLEQMAVPGLARVSGDAFTIITGAELAIMGMEGTAPEEFTLSRCENLAQHPDDGLPWPNVKLVSAWWEENRKKYPEGTRHFLGQPVTRQHVLNILRSGHQRHRAAAALDLAFMNAGDPIFDIQAPASRQVEALSR